MHQSTFLCRFLTVADVARFSHPTRCAPYVYTFSLLPFPIGPSLSSSLHFFLGPLLP